MKHQINLILTVVLCVCILAVSTISVMATESQEDTTVLTSSDFVPSDVASDTSSESSSADNGSSDSVSSGSDSSADISSDVDTDTTSSEVTSSDENASEVVSNPSTSSKRPTTSEDLGAGDTFVDETSSTVNGSNTVSNTGVPSEDSHNDDNYTLSENANNKNSVIKVVWIPILLILICVVGLIYINVFVTPKYEPITKKDNSNVVRRRK